MHASNHFRKKQHFSPIHNRFTNLSQFPPQVSTHLRIIIITISIPQRSVRILPFHKKGTGYCLLRCKRASSLILQSILYLFFFRTSCVWLIPIALAALRVEPCFSQANWMMFFSKLSTISSRFILPDSSKDESS